MLAVFEQVFILFLFAAVGYFLCKIRLVKTEHSQILSALLVYVFLPCNVFKSFASGFTTEYIKENYLLLLISLGATVVIAISAFFSSRLFSKNDYERRVYEYSLTAPNFGYMGYALAESLFGVLGLRNFIVYTFPLSVYVNSYGFCRLTKRPLSLKKLINPPTVAMLLGALWGICNIPMPEFGWSILQKSSGCMAPCSMLLMGIVVSQFSIKDLLKDKKVYIMACLRLLAIPLAIGGILSAFCSKTIVQTAVLTCVMPCGMNTIVFPKLVDENCRIGAGLALVSTVLACGTIPLMLWLFGISL